MAMKTAEKLLGKIPYIAFGFVFVLSSLACNLSINMAEKPTTEPKVTDVIPTSPPQPLPPTEELPTLAPVPNTPTTEVKTRPTATIELPAPTAEIKPATLAPKPSATSRPEGTTVTAATGNLFIRRGPGSTYNIIAGLSKGTTTKAVGRNEKSDWLAIEIPNANGKVGWISMGTTYTQLNGSLQALSLYPFDEAKPAYLQNCTNHDMTTKPGQWNLPANTTQKVNPGEYKILDMSTGQSGVQEVDLKEGNTVSIKKDGNGTSNSCP
jgi:uncharacterized protein YgiM (DUF1202 family)